MLDKFIWAPPGLTGPRALSRCYCEAAERVLQADTTILSSNDYPFFNRDLMSLTGQVSQAGMTLTRLLSDVLMSA